jgi:hypothetical protein
VPACQSPRRFTRSLCSNFPGYHQGCCKYTSEYWEMTSEGHQRIRKSRLLNRLKSVRDGQRLRARHTTSPSQVSTYKVCVPQTSYTPTDPRMSFPQVSVVVNSLLVRLFSTFSLIASPSRFLHIVLQHPREPRSRQSHLLSLISHHIQGVNDKATSDQIRQAYKKECKSPYLPRHIETRLR